MARIQRTKWVAFAIVAVLVTTSCSGGDDGAKDSGSNDTTATTVDPTSVGLWNDPPCDDAKEPLEVGLLATFQSPVLSAEDQAFALEAAATAFNGRGGANGHCIHVTTCDEQADPNTALACVKTFDEAGVAVSINDTTASTPGPEVGDAYEAAGIARFATNSGTPDLSDPNSYPIDAGGIGTTLVMPQGLIDQGVTKIASVRVDVPGASAITGLLDGVYGDQAEIVADIPVAAGTTDYTQFVLSAQNAGAEGVILPLGGQEATQVLKAAQQVQSKLLFSTSLGTLGYSDLAELGDFADQIVLNGATAPATADDVPVLSVLLADLAASGKEGLDAEHLKSTAMKSWIGLYALLDILRTAKTDDFSRANVKQLIDASGPIDMLGLSADWTPNTDNPGTFPRTGNGYYAFWRWDPKAEFDGDAGNLTKTSETNFNDLLCGSSLGAPADTC